MITRDPDVARRAGLSPGMVREVARLAGLTGGSRTGPSGPGNPWLSGSQYLPPRESYGEALGRLARESTRSSPVSTSDETAQAILGALAELAQGWGPMGQALLGRELLDMLQGIGGVLGQGAPLGTPPELIVPSNWEQRRFCPHGSSYPTSIAATNPTTPSCAAFASGTFLFPPPFPIPVQDFDPLINGTWCSFFDTQFTPPNVWRIGYRDSYVWRGPTLTGDAAKAQAIRMVGWRATTGLGVSPVGMAAPLFGLRKKADELRLLMLPNMPLPSVQPSAKTAEAVQAVREGLGLREAVEPVTPYLPQPKPVDKTDGWAQVLPDVRAETQTAGRTWRLGPRHHYAREAFGRTKKLKVSGVAWRVFSQVMNVFTETGDFVESIWKSLPRADRRAGLTRTGNRRVDSMLNDLYRAWPRVDWDQAIANILANQVEDALIGRQMQMMNRLSMASGQGLGTTYSKLLDGAPTSWVSSITGEIESRGPGIIRSVREAVGGT